MSDFLDTDEGAKLLSQKGKWKFPPSVRYVNFHKSYPQLVGNSPFKSWFYVNRRWSGKIINIGIRHHQLTFDFRKNAWADLFP